VFVYGEQLSATLLTLKKSEAPTLGTMNLFAPTNVSGTPLEMAESHFVFFYSLKKVPKSGYPPFGLLPNH